MVNFGKASALKDELTPMLAFIALLSSCGAWTFGEHLLSYPHDVWVC